MNPEKMHLEPHVKNEPEPSLEEMARSLSERMAARMHGDYLENIKDGRNEDGSFKERKRPLKPGDETWASGEGRQKVDAEGKINIAVAFEDLSPGWRADNLRAAEVAIRFVLEAKSRGEDLHSPEFEMRGSEVMHDAWMRRQIESGADKSDYVKPNMVPFQDLTQEEKDKDTAQLRLAVSVVEEKSR